MKKPRRNRLREQIKAVTNAFRANVTLSSDFSAAVDVLEDSIEKLIKQVKKGMRCEAGK